MTDRQVGSEGLNVDFVPIPPDRRAGSIGLNIDVVPVATGMRVLSNLGVMVEYVPSLVASNAVRWATTVFQMGTGAPLVYWSAGAFRLSGTTPVVWSGGKFG